MFQKFLGHFRNGMILVYLAMAGVILFTPVFDHLMPGPETKLLVVLLLVGYSAFRVYRVHRSLKDEDPDSRGHGLI